LLPSQNPKPRSLLLLKPLPPPLLLLLLLLVPHLLQPLLVACGVHLLHSQLIAALPQSLLLLQPLLLLLLLAAAHLLHPLLVACRNHPLHPALPLSHISCCNATAAAVFAVSPTSATPHSAIDSQIHPLPTQHGCVPQSPPHLLQALLVACGVHLLDTQLVAAGLTPCGAVSISLQHSRAAKPLKNNVQRTVQLVAAGLTPRCAVSISLQRSTLSKHCADVCTQLTAAKLLRPVF
jgi:hypothetical protein